MNRFLASVSPGLLVLVIALGAVLVEGQTETTNAATNETPNSAATSPVVVEIIEVIDGGSTSAGSTTAGSTLKSEAESTGTSAGTTILQSTTTLAPQQPKVDPGPALYKLCAARNGTVCYGDKPNCIKNADCTFLGAIQENDTMINMKVLTRVYDPPYDGVNLTVELLRDKKGSESVIRCTRPRFKSFKIKLSWRNKTSFEVPDQPGNETQLAETVINKEDLQRDCEQDLASGVLPSQSLALKLYITNNNTLVSQGLTHVDVQDASKNASTTGSDRQGRNLDPPAPSKEDTLYEMCVKNTAACFGDRNGCTDGHNCTILGVIREIQNNYHVYLVTKSYDPPVSSINLTLTLNTTISNTTSSDNSTDASMMTEGSEDCQHVGFKDLSIQSIWLAKESPQATNGSQILETTVEKSAVHSKCQLNVQQVLKMTNMSDIDSISGETLNFYLKFHLENGTLVPLDASNDGDDDPSSQNETFQIGRNGTAYLVSENTGVVIPSSDPDSSSSLSAGNGALASFYATTCLTLILPSFLAYYHSLI